MNMKDITINKTISKTDAILLRRQTLLDFISAFNDGCWWSMNKMKVALDCTKRILRNDIDFLLSEKLITESKVHKGKKITRTLYSTQTSDYAIPSIVKTKVYTTEPTIPFDMTADELTELHINGYTSDQFYGKWTYAYQLN